MAAMTFASTVVRPAREGYAVWIEPLSDWHWLTSVYDFLTWTPIFAISLIIVGTWIAEIFDALTYRLEGSPTFWGTVLLWSRLRFTRSVLARPAWYPNEDRVQREIVRTNKALSNAGFATLEGLPTASESDVSSSLEYLGVAGAMIWALGVVQAGSMSFAAKALLSMPIALRRDVVIAPPVDGTNTVSTSAVPQSGGLGFFRSILRKS